MGAYNIWGIKIIMIINGIICIFLKLKVPFEITSKNKNVVNWTKYVYDFYPEISQDITERS